MKDLYPYSLESLEEMFGLRKGDIYSLIKSEGIPFYSPLRNDFIGYIPSLGSAFKLDYATESICVNNIQSDSYNISLEESVVSIKSLNRKMPPSALLYENFWLPKALELLNVLDEDFSILISRQIDAPVFCGHHKIIKRLAINFVGDIKIEKVSNFVKECN
jgi:hypothetical protein